MSSVHFDIGSTKYRVSSSLIEAHPQTMLARLVSETWQADPEKEIFVDRNGVCFQHVLEYMRDSRISLPVTVTKNTILQELEYFGFQNIPSDAIDCSCGTAEAPTHVATLAKDHEAEMKQLSDLKFYKSHAYDLVMNYSKTGSLLTRCFLGDKVGGQKVILASYSQKRLNESLAKYGYECSKIDRSRQGTS